MGVEDPKHHEETASGLTPEQVQQDRTQFIRDEMKGKGLSPHHASNIFSTTGLWLSTNSSRPYQAERYTDRVFRWAREQNDINSGELYMELSNPEAVAEFDAHIDSFNANIEEIKKNPKAKKDWIERASEILRKYNV